ncbi:MAG: hypothetical protein AAFS10_27900 [Myxococcota bacterium]
MRQPNPHNPSDPEWGELLEAWHEGDDTALSNTPVLPEQENAMIKATRKLIVKFIVECLAGVFVLVFYAALMIWGDPNTYTVALAAASVMFITLYFAVMTNLFWRTFRPDAHTTEAYLSLKRRRLEARLSWSDFVQLSSVAFGVFMVFWVVWFALDHPDPFDAFKKVARSMLVIYAILGGVIYSARRTKRKLAQELDGLTRLI